MAKSKQPPKQKPEENPLEDALTQFASTATKKAHEYRLPIVVGVGALIGIIGLFSLFSGRRDAEAQRSNANFEAAFKELADIPEEETPDISSLSVDSVVRENLDTFWMVQKYASWLYKRGLKSEAVSLLEKAYEKSPDSELAGLFKSQFEKMKSAAEFSVPVAASATSEDSPTADPGTSDEGDSSSAATADPTATDGTPSETKSPAASGTTQPANSGEATPSQPEQSQPASQPASQPEQ